MQVAATFVKSGLPAINYQCALPRFAKAGLEAAHGEGTGAGGVAEAGEVEDAVEDVGEEFIAEAEAVAFAEGGGDLGADHDLAVREGEDVGRSGVAQMAVVEAAALAGGDQNDAELRW